MGSGKGISGVVAGGAETRRVMSKCAICGGLGRLKRLTRAGWEWMRCPKCQDVQEKNDARKRQKTLVSCNPLFSSVL